MYIEKKSFNVLILLLFACVSIPIQGQVPATDGSWEPLFIDTFRTINNNRWHVLHNDVPGSAAEGKEEKYIHLNSNVYLSQSSPADRWLSLTLEKPTFPVTHPAGQDCMYFLRQHWYTAGRVESWDRFHYGYFEIKTLLPVGDCHFPAFWLWWQNDEAYNEIDIMEVFKGMDNKITTHVLYSFDPPFDTIDHLPVDTFPISNTHNYHVYAAEWTKSRIIWFIDGEIVKIDANNYEGIGLQIPMHLIFNIVRYPSCSDKKTIYPGEMRVKHVSVYSMKCDSLTVVNSIPDFETYNYALKKSISLGGETTIPSNASIALRATDYIEWRPGFEIPQGTEMYFEVGHYK